MLERPPADRRRRAASARTRRWRARGGERIVVGVEIDGDVIDYLVKTIWLSDRDAADRGKIGEAIAAMLADSSKG
jgi:hypothetical protein